MWGFMGLGFRVWGLGGVMGGFMGTSVFTPSR